MSSRVSKSRASDLESNESIDGDGPVDSGAASRASVLIVEDDPDMALILSALLDPDYQTVLANDGVEGLAALDRHHVDLIITDVMMPNMDGAAMVTRIRSQSQFDDVPIIILTAVADPEQRVRMLESGATDFLSKPFSPQELLARVRNVDDAAQLRRRLQANLDRRTAQLIGANQRLIELTEHDPLTGLANRTSLIDFLERLTDQAGQPETCGILLISIDDIGRINDALGFSAGDMCLIEVGRRLSAFCGPNDLLLRLDGSRFALAVCDQQASLTRIAEQILRTMASPITIGDHSVVSGASVGIAIGDAGDPDSLLRHADLAARRAKLEGTYHSAIFYESLHTEAANRLEMEQAVRIAVANRDFTLHYQPEFELATGKPRGFEALIRWSPEPGRNIPPGDFLPAAQAAGLMPEIDRWVLGTACRESLRWKDHLLATRSRVWVNISAHTLLSHDLTELVGEAIAAAGGSADLIGIEVVETIAMDVALPQRHFDGLVVLGIQLAIDDFGTGYSSLARLRELPISMLKVDMSLVRHLGQDPKAALVVRAAIEMGHAMGFTVLAEGIETPQQQRELLELGCDLGQGFLLGRPGPPDQINIEP